MNCAVVVPNVSHNPFSPSSSCSSCNNNILSVSSHPMSPNVMVRFQKPLEGPISSSNHHHHHRRQELPLLKRKRPAMINVPVVRSGNLFNVVDTPKECKEKMDEIEVEGDGYGVYCKRGRSRAHLEDRYSALTTSGNNDFKQAFFGIFDGHGGAKAAEFAAARLGQKILETIGKETQIEHDDNKLVEGKIRDGYLATDSEFLRSNSGGGTCCATVLVQHGKVLVSNVGDCRAVISRGGLAEALTTDHSPSREDEKTRIEAKGGYVDYCNGVWRIQGSLAVSRAIGDQHLKEWVIAEPDTTIVDIRPDHEFLILASDGLWSKVTNQEAVDIVLPYCNPGINTFELAPACKKLAHLAITKGSNDDISIMIIQLAQLA